MFLGESDHRNREARRVRSHFTSHQRRRVPLRVQAVHTLCVSAHVRDSAARAIYLQLQATTRSVGGVTYTINTTRSVGLHHRMNDHKPSVGGVSPARVRVIGDARTGPSVPE